MKVKINSNFYIIIYFILMVLMNQSIGLSYINVISLSFLFILLKDANSHFLRTAGPHFPDSQGHIKRTALEIGRAERVPPC